jgi:hypothetical protein
MKGDPLKKSEIILARHAGKMIFTVPDKINRTGKALFHEPEVMNTGDLPPRSAEILWKLAMERKKNTSAGEQMSNEVIANDIPGNLISLNVPEYQIRYLYPGFRQKDNAKPAPLLHSAKESETPMLPMTGSLPILHGKGR